MMDFHSHARQFAKDGDHQGLRLSRAGKAEIITKYRKFRSVLMTVESFRRWHTFFILTTSNFSMILGA